MSEKNYYEEQADVIAEAEERGRRAGIEDAAKLLDAKIAAQKSFAYYVTDPRGNVSLQEGPHDLLLSARGIATEIRALAPRDSAPVCDCEARLWGGGHIASCAAYPRKDRK